MIEIQTQVRDLCPLCKQSFGLFYLPFGDESAEKAKDHLPNQVVSNRITGIRKQRSVAQLRTYWACCKTVAENMDNPQWSSKEKTDFQCRVTIHFVDPNLVAVKPDGTVVFHYRSISFKNLRHMEACRYFDRAFEVMAKALGTTPEKLVEMAKADMVGY